MRELYQILSIPYRIVDGKPLFCVFHRADSSYWQFVSGGGENGETPLQAAIRETIEEIECPHQLSGWLRTLDMLAMAGF